MMEFQAVIKVGRNNMKVLFTDGSMNAMGVNPAKFTTTNYMVQHAIENSPEFKRGLIKRISVIDLDENVQIERYTQPAAPAPAPTPATESDNAPTAEPAPEQTAEADDDDADAEAESEIAEAPEAEQEDTEAGEAPEAKADLPRVEVEFAINDDAKDYLEQNYGAVRSKLRTRSDILAFAEAHNVDIKFV